jgi:hypothetical protein
VSAADGEVTETTTGAPGIAAAFADAILARDFAQAISLLHPEIDFRAMTPNRIWEADGPAAVESVLRKWLDDPDEDVEQIGATDPAVIENTARVGWLVRLTDAEGPQTFEQQAYVRERDGQIGWLRVMCTGAVPRDEPPALSQ